LFSDLTFADQTLLSNWVNLIEYQSNHQTWETAVRTMIWNEGSPDIPLMKPETKVKIKNDCTYLYVLKLHLSLRVISFYESTPIPDQSQAKQPVLVLFTGFQ
jgi:hypothetical protein